MATGGGMGRGGRGLALLHQLKKKEEEKEERTLPPILPKEEKMQTPLSSITAEKPKLPFGRGGLMTSLLQAKAAKKQEEPEESLTAAAIAQEQVVIRRPSIEQAEQDVRRLSLSEKPLIQESEVAKSSSHVTAGVQAIPSTLTSKGRGFMFSKIKPEIATTLPPPPPLTQVNQPKEPSPSKLTETTPTVKNVEMKTTEQPKPIEKKQSSSGAKSHFASDISHKTMERALEEIKVEEIKRTSPVKKIGTAGKPANLSANYIRFKCKNAGVYQYVVYFDPPVESRQSRIRMLKGLVDIIGNVNLFDGMTLFLPIMLKEQLTIAKSQRPTDGHETIIKIQLTKILPPEQIPPVVFNIIFRNIMCQLKMKQIGQHYYNPLQSIKIPQHNLEIWPGYTTAVHEYEDGLYLVADVSHKIIPSRTCLQLLNTLKEGCRDLPTLKQEAINALVGSVVLTPYNNRTYRIDDILWELTPLSEFVYHNGQQCTYKDYYKQHYGYNISDLSQPLLLNRVKKSKSTSPTQQQQQHEMICLVPELCVLTGLTDDMRKDFRVMKDLAIHTRLAPPERHESLKMFIDTIRNTPNALKQITNWGLELDFDTTDIDGRILPDEAIIAGRDALLTNKDSDWNRDIGRNPVLSSVNLKKWIIIFTRNNAKVAENFVETCYNCCKQMGIMIDEPYVLEINDDRAETYVRELKNKINDQTQLVCIIFPTSRDDRYAAVKRLCCIEIPVPSQVIIAKTIMNEKNLRSVAQKIILQINCKLGGELWRLKMPIQKLMVIGIDVYHQVEKKYKSIAGFVSSLNNDQTRWYSKVCFQMVGQELIDSMKVAFANSIKKYQEINGFLPEKIIIYRDGVSDGQLSYVSEHEVEQLRSVFSEDYSPKLAVCIVQKRISARIFASDSTTRYKNAPPGTIVDHSITRRELYDFFLVSQHVRQGTVTPTHYIIVYDDTQFQTDHMQRLSYKLTHLYYNWPGTIRVPAPCQYAHKLAFLTGQFLQKDPDPQLCNRLFYL